MNILFHKFLYFSTDPILLISLNYFYLNTLLIQLIAFYFNTIFTHSSLQPTINLFYINLLLLILPFIQPSIQPFQLSTHPSITDNLRSSSRLQNIIGKIPKFKKPCYKYVADYDKANMTEKAIAMIRKCAGLLGMDNVNCFIGVYC